MSLSESIKQAEKYYDDIYKHGHKTESRQHVEEWDDIEHNGKKRFRLKTDSMVTLKHGLVVAVDEKRKFRRKRWWWL